MSMFARHICDYEVTGMFNKVDGEQVVTKRICHNVSKREAAARMKRYVQPMRTRWMCGAQLG